MTHGPVEMVVDAIGARRSAGADHVALRPLGDDSMDAVLDGFAGLAPGCTCQGAPLFSSRLDARAQGRQRMDEALTQRPALSWFEPSSQRRLLHEHACAGSEGRCFLFDATGLER